jgi:hypothetical protein
VYRHRADLGGLRLGSGSRPTWRFDVERATRSFPISTPPKPVGPTRRTRRRSSSGVPLLPIG